MKLTNFYQVHLPQVEAVMTEFVVATTNEVSLQESMLYSIRAGGKRLRPALVLGTLEFLQTPLERGHYQVAAALEMIHTYSLIHDDLPAMDNDELRRGKPTNHIVYGEGLAILAGDGLLTGAFQLLSQAELPAEMRLHLLHELSLAAGNQGMIAGQVADLAAENQVVPLSALEFIHQRKTGALIEFAVMAAGQLSQVSAPVMSALQQFARHFGLAFQIKDDLLDVLGDEATIGKKTGMDASLAKSTYTSLLGVAGAQEALNEQIDLAEAALTEAAERLGRATSPALLTELLALLTLNDERRDG